MRSVMMLALSLSNVAADVVLSRTVNSVATGTSGLVTIAPATACTGSDQYGSNNCDVNWGQAYTVNYSYTLGADIVAGSTISIDAHIDTFIHFQHTCVACGGLCTVTVPIIGKKISYQMPDCPILAGSSPPTLLSFTLPSKSPIPVHTGVVGTLTANDAAGNVLANISLTATITPSCGDKCDYKVVA